jgi:flagellar biosynthetic protein FlhB
MADENDTADKTEDPTQKRLDDAHDRGDVAKSQEINTWFVIVAGTLLLSTFSGSIGGGIVMPLRNLVANSWMIHADGPGLMALAKSLEYVLIAVLGVPPLMLALAAIAGNMVQHRLVWSGESLKPKLSKISLAAGAKRIFGKQAAANFGRGVFKVAALGAVMTGARHVGAGLRGQGRRYDRTQDQGNRRRARYPHRRECTAGEGLACRRGDR